jgi:hypothetical protein
MLSSLAELGRMGMTAIGRSATDAQQRYDQVMALLLGAAEEAAVAVA